MSNKRFSDFATEETQLEGAKAKIDDLLNKEIEIVAFRLADTRFSKNTSGKYATVQFRKDNCTCIFFSGSDVIIDQLQKYSEQLPFVAVVKKINRYYTLS